MLLWIRRKGMYLILLFIGVGIFYWSYIHPSFQPSYIIAVVTVSQSSTSSLHPTRIKAALSICWEDYWKEKEPRIPLQLKYYTYDGQGPAQSQIEKKLQEDKVIAIIGDISSTRTSELAKIAQNLKVPHFSPIATDESIIRSYPWTFSPRVRLKHESEAIIDIIQSQLNRDEIVLLSTDFGGFQNRYQDFKERAIAMGISIILDLPLHFQQEDFHDVVARIQDLPPEIPVVTFITTNNTIDLYQQMNIFQIPNPRISSSTVMNQEMVNYLGEAGQGVYSAIVSFYLLGEEEEKSRNFSHSYVENLGTGRVDHTALSIYESLWVLLDIIADVGVNPEKIRDRLFHYRGQPLMGFISFDEDGLLKENNHRIVQIRNGEIIPK